MAVSSDDTLSTLDPSAPDWRWHDARGLTRLINVSGTMTGLGASVCSRSVQEATCAAMAHFASIHELQSTASAAIAALTGAEAGCLTASASAAITLSVAGCLTGVDAARAEALPREPGPRSQVVVQAGHLCGYGAPVATAIELSGAAVRSVGQSTLVMDHQLEAALDADCIAAMYVVSHHVVHYGQIPFGRFVEICSRKGVPVIVDAASEQDLRGFIASGADLAIYSAHKFMGGPTAGIVAGSRERVRATYLQNIGIGRGFKIGKESIAGAIAAIEQWATLGEARPTTEERAALQLWAAAVDGVTGIDAQLVDDPTGNPIQRLQVNVDAHAAGASAATLARVLAEQGPAIIVRNHEVELGYFQLDPCNLLPGHAHAVARVLREVLIDAGRHPAHDNDLAAARNGGVAAYLGWLGAD